MRINLTHIIPLLIIIGLVACNISPKDDHNNSNSYSSNETDKYTGHYISQDEACDIKISVKKIDKLYKYQITTANIKNTGNLKIDTVKYTVYFVFTNLNSESEGYAIKAQVNDDELIIQNYGNAMNQYHHIKDCGVKYIYLTKEKTN